MQNMEEHCTMQSTEEHERVKEAPSVLQQLVDCHEFEQVLCGWSPQGYMDDGFTLLFIQAFRNMELSGSCMK